MVSLPPLSFPPSFSLPLQFYIKDTKSSNGTFVNENRLSASGEESEPVELKSRDIVQFGVNVNVEKKCKCVVPMQWISIAISTLYAIYILGKGTRVVQNDSLCFQDKIVSGS